MHRLLLVFIACVTVPATVFACEGDCIVGITNAFLGNYTSGPIPNVFKNIAVQLSEILPNHAMSSESALSVLQPILDVYQNQSYSTLRTAIFPSYFHGKCQVNGVDPAGCPNPDCPVVCGTPGSLVHFYSKLLSIVLDCIQDLFRTLVSPDSDAYQRVEREFLAHASTSSKTERVSITKRMRDVFDRFPTLMEQACGDSSLSSCSWEADMKSFILSFP